MKFFVSFAGVDNDDADCLLLGARLLRPRRRLRPLPPPALRGLGAAHSSAQPFQL